MRKREAFLQVVSKDTVKEFVHYVQLHKDLVDPFDLNELLQELPRKLKETLWERLTHLLTQILVLNPVEGWQRIEDESDDDDMEVEENPKMKQIIDVIQGVTTVVTASVPVVDENIDYEALLECALILNGILYALPESEKVLQGAIQHLCEMWWEKGLKGKEQLGKTAFIILLRKSLKSKTGADIVRLWHLHQTLLCFDYDLEESNEVKDLLLQCFMSVNHLKKEEGRRFLSFLLSWNVNFIKMIHGTIKNQLQCFPKSLMAYVAEIYFRAWKKSSGEILEVLEHNCIQDFMHHGIHLPRSSPVHPKVRELLSYFHKQSKVRQGVEEMLYRLYQPILWRALKARNSEVRSNAALLFVEAFPIRDPHFNYEDMDNEIQKQFEELFNLLEDPQPLVRSTGILGVSKITSKYWEMIPATILAELLKKLIGDLAFDVTSADVRCSVFKCLPIILDNKLSHPLLEQLLPTRKTSSERRVRIQVTHESKPELALDYVEYLLTHSMNRDCLLSVPKKKLNQLLKVLGESLGSIMKATDAGSHSFNQATAVRAFTLYCRLSIHLQHKFSSEGKVYLSHLKETGAWIESHVLPSILTHEQEENILEQHTEIYQLIIQAYLTVCKDAVMVGLGDSEFQAHLLDVTLSIMQTERFCFCIPTLICVLKEIIEASLAQNIGTDEEVATFLHAVQALFQKILECVARRLRKQQEEGLQLIHSIQMPLGEFINTVQCWHSTCPAVLHDVLSTLLAAVVVEISHTLRKASNAEELAPPESIADLPPLSGCLMAMIIKSINVVRSFLNELMECIVADEIEGIISLTAAVYIVVIIKGKRKASLAKDIVHALQRKLMTYREVAMEESSSIER
uniref:Non-SMC condensin II complex subunit G2 n=1 Tax=Pelusios castaneus TaxID=367368 RepID=A0A8C8RY30_9SAUR